ncbi:MAG TPA: phosphoribosyltransferase family protein [Longimicrobiales bacterium]|nr:phosphoribosyltransferase family protein [Longimicrobiales bacterium]
MSARSTDAASQFANRAEAGRLLADELREYAGRDDVIVLGLPRGGIPVAYEVARALEVPLDAFLVRKLGLPGHEELAMGAIASGGTRVLNADVLDLHPVSEERIAAVAAQEEEELERREREYRRDRGPLDLEGHTVILVDDGLATGSTMRAAVAAIRASRPAGIVVAVPVAARETCDALRREVDAVVCPRTPDPFQAVGVWYRTFDQTTDEEVRDCLARAAG